MAEVTVFSTKYIRGWNGERERLEEIGAPGEIVDLREALTREWGSDAHFAQYRCPGEERSPRLNKPALGFFETQAPGKLPELTSVAVDVDFPDHGDGAYGWEDRDCWPGPFREWYAQLNQAHEDTPELKRAGFYATAGGCRYVWPLSEPISAKMAESYLEQFQQYLASKGLPLDLLPEWNRLYRLPRVVRDGVEQDLPIDLSNMEPLGWAPPEPLAEVSLADRGSAARDEIPDVHELDTPNLSDLKPLEDCWFYRHLRNDLPLAEPGERHNTLRQVVGAIVAIFDTDDPIVPLQIVRDCVEEMRSERGDELTWGEVWDLCVWTCEVHDGRQRAQRETEQSLIEETADAMGCDPADVRSRLILAPKSSGIYYVWDEAEEAYQTPTSNQTQLLSLLDTHCPRLAALARREGATGVPKLLRDYSTPVDDVAISYVADETRYEPGSRRVVEATLRRDPSLSASFHEHVHEWLKRLFDDRAGEGLDWLATFLRFSRPTCAVYIHGPRDVGKGLLASGLTRLWRAAPVPYKDLLDDFQGSLRGCPLVLADEQVPSDPFAETGSAVFRRMIGTARFKLNIKHRQKGLDLIGCPRVLITANNADALRIREALNRDDIRAIQQRIGYLQTTTEPREYLRRAAEDGGFDAVQDMTETWVDGGKIAEHVLWLNAHRSVDIGDRLLVEGWKSDLTADIALRFGAVPALGRYLCRVIRDQQTLPGIRYGDGELKVNFGRVRESWGDVMGRSSQPPSDSDLAEALKVLSEGEKERIRPSAEENPRYFWAIDVESLSKIAEDQHVTDSETIERVVQAGSEREPRGRPLHAVDGDGDQESS